MNKISASNTFSGELNKRAIAAIPGGVNSPVRSFKSVGHPPIYAASGKGSKLTDVDGNVFIDYVMSYGPLIFGHAPDFVTKAIIDAAPRGTTYGATTQGEVEIAELMCKMVPSLEKVRLVNSGTEAVMSAVRLARGFTGREKVVKFAGCYHGHSDGLLAKAGSGLTTLSLPDSQGVPKHLTEDTIVLPYNDADAFVDLMHSVGKAVAAVIVEPVAANMGVVLPEPGFLESLREWTTKSGAILIFDEVISGFRLAPGGAQELLGITPDITTLGKIAGGGLPLAAYGGKAEIMDFLAPDGPVYQAGTLNGNPLAVAAGLAALRRLDQNPQIYQQIDSSMERLTGKVSESIMQKRIPATINRFGSLATIFFSRNTVTDYETAKLSDTAAYAKFFAKVYERGVFLAPSQFEAMFVSAAHSDADIDQTAEIISESLT